MSNFLTSLLERVQGRAPVLQRRRPSRFETPRDLQRLAPALDTEVESFEAQDGTRGPGVPTTRTPDFAGHESRQPVAVEPRAQRSTSDDLSPARAAARTSSITARLAVDQVATDPDQPRPGRSDHAVATIRGVETMQPSPAQPVRQLGPRVGALTTTMLRDDAQQEVTESFGLHERVSQDTAPLVRLAADRSVHFERRQVASVIATQPDRTNARRSVPPLNADARPVATPPNHRMASARQVQGEPPRTAPTVIEVNIGRIEVQTTAHAPATARAATPKGPRLELDQYLRSRGGRS